MVAHKAILVNGKVVNIRSYQVQPGDVVSVREKGQKATARAVCFGYREQRGEPIWVEVDVDKLEGPLSLVPSDRIYPAKLTKT